MKCGKTDDELDTHSCSGSGCTCRSTAETLETLKCNMRLLQQDRCLLYHRVQNVESEIVELRKYIDSILLSEDISKLRSKHSDKIHITTGDDQ